MKAGPPVWTASRVESSIEFDRFGSATPDFATSLMTVAALTAGSPSLTLPLSSTACPPAELISVLNHTVRPSYCAPWISIVPFLAPSFLAISIIRAHVLGGVGTLSLRYHRNCTLDVYGAA